MNLTLTNRWLVALTELYIGQHAPNPWRFDLQPHNSHLYADHLCRHELEEEGLANAIREATLAFMATNWPDLARDDHFPDMVTVVYANARRSHIGPGADHLIPISVLQPANVWTVEATLDSNVMHPAARALIVDVQPDNPED